MAFHLLPPLQLPPFPFLWSAIPVTKNIAALVKVLLREKFMSLSIESITIKTTLAPAICVQSYLQCINSEQPSRKKYGTDSCIRFSELRWNSACWRSSVPVCTKRETSANGRTGTSLFHFAGAFYLPWARPRGSPAYCLHFACDEVCTWYKISGLTHNRRAVASIQAVQTLLTSMRHAWLSVPSTEGISKLKTNIVGCLCGRQTPSALTSF